MNDLIEIRWHGRGGQGAKTASLLLADAAFNTGNYIQGFPEYGPERMGAPITAYNRISKKPIFRKERYNMKVILQQDVKGQGKKGQMIEASDGYARNFLLPRKLAVPATAENINTMKMQEKAKKAQEAAEKAEAQAIAEKLSGLTVKVVAKGGNGGRLFGAVTSKEISDALKAQHNIDIAKTKIVQEEPIKAFGGYKLKVKLGYEITGTLSVMVVEE